MAPNYHHGLRHITSSRLLHRTQSRTASKLLPLPTCTHPYSPGNHGAAAALTTPEEGTTLNLTRISDRPSLSAKPYSSSPHYPSPNAPGFTPSTCNLTAAAYVPVIQTTFQPPILRTVGANPSAAQEPQSEPVETETTSPAPSTPTPPPPSLPLLSLTTSSSYSHIGNINPR